MLIAIDGPAGAGKSTVARALARRLGFTYLDSGALYRCVGLRRMEHPERASAELARAADIKLPAGRVLLDGVDVTEKIRAPLVSEEASRAAADPGVREALLAKQRKLLADGDWVAEGRDIGTVVAPLAELKIFLTADAAERARRRSLELGAEVSIVMAEQQLRDKRDSARTHSPLRLAEDAHQLDTTGLSVEQVVDRIVGILRAR